MVFHGLFSQTCMFLTNCSYHKVKEMVLNNNIRNLDLTIKCFFLGGGGGSIVEMKYLLTRELQNPGIYKRN